VPPSNSDVCDIEDTCMLCEPLSKDSVTAYPMKVERKKAREELDIVNVVEWRNEKRWFLLIRRPEEGGCFFLPRSRSVNDIIPGLLAGLHEFPTSPNVTAVSASKIANTAFTFLSTFIKPALLPLSSQFEARSSNMLRITNIRPAGDVVHVFSHIKKTYRVQWVSLEGGGNEPPQLTQIRLDAAKKSTPQKERKQKFKEKDHADEGDGNVVSRATAKWIPLDQVTDAK
jgi:A/G-specific adenine glycosylase